MKVRIYKPLTHGGITLTPDVDGLEVEVSAPDAEFLRNRGLLDRPVDEATLAAIGIIDATRTGDATRRRQSFATPATPEAASGNDLADKTSADTKRTST